jgi:hypothetical protein
LFAAIFQFIKKGVKNVQAQEWYCICGSLITFLLFSASKFQLPHYLNIVFPFFAIITAQYLCHLTSLKSIQVVRLTQTVAIVFLLMVLGLLEYFFRPETFGWLAGLIIAIFMLLLIFLPQQISTGIQQTIYRTILISFIVNLFLNLCFYPSLLHYQSGSEAAMWINHNNAIKLPVYIDDGQFHDDMNFYLDAPFTEININSTDTLPGPVLLYTSADAMSKYISKGWDIKVVKILKNYPVTRLSLPFLNKATRDKELNTMEVAIVNPPKK